MLHTVGRGGGEEVLSILPLGKINSENRLNLFPGRR